ncbi:MAG: hypothetical protein KDD40_11060, partial [Bdellovibrionales bacterium]|nr:hypothetical protein [Bdellovibrionales bacterium]
TWMSQAKAKTAAEQQANINSAQSLEPVLTEDGTTAVGRDKIACPVCDNGFTDAEIASRDIAVEALKKRGADLAQNQNGIIPNKPVKGKKTK